jgi:hypothetical protein
VTVAFDQCSKVVRNPESWAVERTDAEVWLLLSEGKCYTAPEAIAAARARQLKWPHEVQCGLRLASRGSQAADTCSFDATRHGGMVVGVSADNARGEVALLWQTLQQVRSGDENHGATTRHGVPLPSTRCAPSQRPQGEGSNSSRGPSASAAADTPMFQRTFSKRASERREKDDHMLSALFHWRCHLAARAFAAWQMVHRQQKLSQQLSEQLSQQLGAEAARADKGKVQGTQVAAQWGGGGGGG